MAYMGGGMGHWWEPVEPVPYTWHGPSRQHVTAWPCAGMSHQGACTEDSTRFWKSRCCGRYRRFDLDEESEEEAIINLLKVVGVIIRLAWATWDTWGGVCAVPGDAWTYNQVGVG